VGLHIRPIARGGHRGSTLSETKKKKKKNKNEKKGKKKERRKIDLKSHFCFQHFV